MSNENIKKENPSMKPVESAVPFKSGQSEPVKEATTIPLKAGQGLSGKESSHVPFKTEQAAPVKEEKKDTTAVKTGQGKPCSEEVPKEDPLKKAV